jgi:hypothetical protein
MFKIALSRRPSSTRGLKRITTRVKSGSGVTIRGIARVPGKPTRTVLDWFSAGAS